MIYFRIAQRGNYAQELISPNKPPDSAQQFDCLLYDREADTLTWVEFQSALRFGYWEKSTGTMELDKEPPEKPDDEG